MTELDDFDLAQRIYIKTKEVQLFRVAWENLMSDFRIPKLHQPPIFEVMQNFFLRLDNHSLYVYEINSAVEALNFFISYIQRFNESVKDKTPIEIDKYAKVRFELSGIETEFKYPSSSQTVAKALYSYLRIHDNFLRHYLRAFEQLPSIDDLLLVKMQLGYKLGIPLKLTRRSAATWKCVPLIFDQGVPGGLTRYSGAN